MKIDLFTSILAGAAGVIIAFFVANLLLPQINNVTIRTLTDVPTSSLTSPDPEIFNYRAINPTVEVYVGKCTEYNDAGECIDDGVSNKTPESDTSDTTDTSSNPNSSTDQSSEGSNNG